MENGINIKDLINRFEKSSHKLSYSKFKRWQDCEFSWFVDNYIESDETEINQRYAITGTIIQRIFQEIINEKIYTKYSKVSQFNEWILQNVKGLYDCIAFPISSQHNKEINNQHYFTTPKGISELRRAQIKYPLFTITSDIAPNYVSELELIKDYTSIENLKYTVANIIIENTKTICSNLKLDLQKTVSEIYIKYQTEKGLILSGRVDFIERDYTSENYFVFDGKFNLNQYADIRQLIYYSYIIYKNHNTIPYKAGFCGWKDSEFNEVSVSLEDFKKLEEHLIEYENRIPTILTLLKDVKSDYITLKELNKIFKTNSTYLNCRFCSSKLFCSNAYSGKK